MNLDTEQKFLRDQYINCMQVLESIYPGVTIDSSSIIGLMQVQETHRLNCQLDTVIDNQRNMTEALWSIRTHK